MQANPSVAEEGPRGLEGLDRWQFSGTFSDGHPVMESATGFTGFHGVVRAWLARARDDEVRALAAVVAAELERRKLEPEAPAQQERS